MTDLYIHLELRPQNKNSQASLESSVNLKLSAVHKVDVIKADILELRRAKLLAGAGPQRLYLNFKVSKGPEYNSTMHLEIPTWSTMSRFSVGERWCEATICEYMHPYSGHALCGPACHNSSATTTL